MLPQVRYGELHVDELQVDEGIIKQHFYHHNCMDWKDLEGNLVHGLDDLKEVDQKQIRKELN
ncbi:MAG: hypothetical protein KGD64_10580 [Candidatus Heimdallarchaeota archaeon]|nr:hypothetical protein [Candidatus Heimdallarchaeota archaeon]